MVQVICMVGPVVCRGSLVGGLDGRTGGDVARMGTGGNVVWM